MECTKVNEIIKINKYNIPIIEDAAEDLDQGILTSLGTLTGLGLFF